MKDSPMLRRHYEPGPDEKVWVRSAANGERGWLCRRDGMTYVRLDRPSQELLRPYRQHDWIEEAEHRPLTPMQIAQICFEADRAFCKVLNLHDLARKDWMSLTDRERGELVKNGPGGEPRRRGLYELVRKYLEGLSE